MPLKGLIGKGIDPVAFDHDCREGICGEKVMINEQVVEDLQNIIVQLPEDQRDVLNMRLYKDMSFKEIAESTGVSINTALGRMRYAIINLRKIIEENQIILSA